MPVKNHRSVPSCRRQKQRGGHDRAFVEINGQRRYLGRYGSDEAREAYDRLIAEWLAGGRHLPVDPDELTLTELIGRFADHIEGRYDERELVNYRSAMRVLRQLYGSEPAASFGPRRLRTVRDQFVRKEWARSHINKQVGRVRHLFRWATSHELIPGDVVQRLTALEPLRKGEAKREGRKVGPVPRGHIRRIWPHLSRQVRGLVLVQRLTGARANELVQLKATDVDTSGPVWSISLAEHKTAHHGKGRVIYFGPRAQRVLRQFMVPGRALDRPLFSPRDAAAERYAACRTHGKRKPARTERALRDAYCTTTYRSAIYHACKKAGVSKWSPHQLRHSAATAIRREFGVEAAQTILGHANLKTTEIYAQADAKKAREIIGKVG